VVPSSSTEDEISPVARVGDFIIATLIYDFGTKKETEKKYVGRVESDKAGRYGNQYDVTFLKKVVGRVEDDVGQFYFVFPNLPDKFFIGNDQIVAKLFLKSIKRGRHYFLDDDTSLFSDVN
jgi:hypothetical protein